MHRPGPLLLLRICHRRKNCGGEGGIPRCLFAAVVYVYKVYNVHAYQFVSQNPYSVIGAVDTVKYRAKAARKPHVPRNCSI